MGVTGSCDEDVGDVREHELEELFFVMQRNEGCQCMQFTGYDVGINMLSSGKNEGSRPSKKKGT